MHIILLFFFLKHQTENNLFYQNDLTDSLQKKGISKLLWHFENEKIESFTNLTKNVEEDLLHSNKPHTI